MRLFYSLPTLAVLAASLAQPTTVFAQALYLSGSGGLINQSESSNAGEFTSDFVTGEVTGVSPPLTIPAGSGVGWDTEFDRGDFWSVALGADLDGFRIELEFRESNSDVDTHRGVSAAGMDLSAIDAGVLITGNSSDLGVSVADLVANGRGKFKSQTLMLNAYYDLDLGIAITPYIGVGLGSSDSDVTYSPSNTLVLSGGDDDFAYQLIAGASYSLTETWEVFLNYRFMSGEDFSVSSELLPASFEIENQSQTLDLGLRFSF